ncbi:MAG: hypothetical protein K6G91_08160 [Kiritimatiellae bacterium]|nr:hypothetical protein [Kiritimatiellia bacterium]
MKLLKIQEAVADALKGADGLEGADVVVEDQGDVAKRLEASIAKTSRCILVQTPGFRGTSSASKVMVGTATVVVQAIERLVTGRAGGGPTAQDMAEIAAWRLNMLPAEGVGVLVFKEISSETLDERTLSYLVRLEVQTTLGDPFAEGRRASNG